MDLNDLPYQFLLEVIDFKEIYIKNPGLPEIDFTVEEITLPGSSEFYINIKYTTGEESVDGDIFGDKRNKIFSKNFIIDKYNECCYL